MTRAKVCGVTTAADRDAVCAAGADAFGVIVDVPVETPRAVDPETAAALVAGAPPFVTTVLVTMPTTVQDAAALQRTVGADAIQVHGTLAPPFLGGLARRTDAAVIGTVAVDDPALDTYASHVDALLVDSTDDEGGGGTGEPVDWDRAAAVVANVDVPVVLGGGLTPATVERAIETVAPHAVDVASGVERAGGVKDHDAVRAFVETAHATEVAA